MILLWIGFIVVVVVLMALDLGLLHREAHAIGIREALIRTGGWVALALAFNLLVYFIYEHDWLNIAWFLKDEAGRLPPNAGRVAATEFVTGYIVEQSLSMDNMMVFALIFAYFKVPLAQQHRVLFWGVVGAFLLRGMMIAAGAALIHQFEWITYVFGALLLVTAVRLIIVSEGDIHPERSLAVVLARKVYPVTTDFHGSLFFVSHGGRKAMTPLFLALLLVSTADAVFAIDSIPAIFAITRDPFIVFTSNVFAVLGLRSLYFALAGMLDRFRYLKPSLIFLLAFIGVKMMVSHYYTIDTLPSLAIIAGILGVGVISSLIAEVREKRSPSN